MKCNNFAIGVDIGGSHVSSAVVNLDTGEIYRDIVVTDDVDCHANAQRIIDIWVGNIRSLIIRSGISVGRVGFAFPGPFDYANGVSLISGVRKFDSIYGINVSESMYSGLSDIGVTEFRYVNDASAFALGECLGGAAKDADRVMVLTLGTGLGSGFVCHRKLIESGDEVPANGWVYCLDFRGAIADDAFTSRWIVGRYSELSGNMLEGAREVADRCESDELAKLVFDEYGCRLADFIVPIFDRFKGDTLLLGGNISRAYRFFGPAFEAKFITEERKAKIRISSLMDRAAMTGAASLFL